MSKSAVFFIDLMCWTIPNILALFVKPARVLGIIGLSIIFIFIMIPFLIATMATWLEEKGR